MQNISNSQRDKYLHNHPSRAGWDDSIDKHSHSEKPSAFLSMSDIFSDIQILDQNIFELKKTIY